MLDVIDTNWQGIAVSSPTLHFRIINNSGMFFSDELMANFLGLSLQEFKDYMIKEFNAIADKNDQLIFSSPMDVEKAVEWIKTIMATTSKYLN